MTSASRNADGAAPIAVVELELTGPRLPLTVPYECRMARILVRAHGVPVAWVSAPAVDGVVAPEELGAGLVAAGPSLSAAAVRGYRIAPLGEDPPPISIVVCTRDRPESLARCLESLAALDYPRYEIVLVDNAPSTDATERLSARYPVRYVREQNPGLDWARNRGVAEAEHELIAFTDDDVRVDRLWLRALAGAFVDPAVGLVTGFVAPSSLRTEAERIFELAYGGMGKGFARKSVSSGRDDAWRLLSAHHIGVGANMAFRRAALVEIGAFDTALDVGTYTHGGGDLDVFHRVVMSGWTAHYEPAALVWHAHRVDMRGLRRQMYDNGRAFGAYLLTRWRDAGISRRTTLAYAAQWIGWLNGRLVRRLLGRERVPLPLLMREIWGALHAPWGYARARSHDRRMRASLSSSASTLR